LQNPEATGAGDAQRDRQPTSNRNGERPRDIPLPGEGIQAGQQSKLPQKPGIDRDITKDESLEEDERR